MTYNYSDISLQEFPGEIALILYTGGCVCACPWCFNGELLNKKPLSYKQMKDAIDEHIDFITAVVFTGGEPLLNRFLIKAINYAKRKGLKIKVNTNGLVHQNVRFNMYIPYVDYINISLKGNYNDYKQVLKSLRVSSGILHCNVLEYSLVYSPTLWPQKRIENFHSFLKKIISFNWYSRFSDRFSQPDIFTVNQIKTGNCLNSDYNDCRVPTRMECISVAKVFSDIPLKEIMIETNEFGKEKVKCKKEK